jgi:hypothetical protein
MRRTLTALALASVLVPLGTLAHANGLGPWGAAVNAESVPGTSSELNTPSLDGCPIVSPDALSLYMASDRPGGFGKLDIWVARRASRNAPFGAPVNLGEPVNSAEDDFCPSPVAGKSFLFVSTRTGGCGDADIYLTRAVGKRGWWEPLHLGCRVNSSGQEASPYLLTHKGNGRVLLYFSSNRPAGFAPDSGPPDADLYVSRLTQFGFGPARLVPGLNTAANDARPNLRSHDREIVFDSNRPGTLGGQDIYAATRTGVGASWSTAVNLGAGVNTSAMETRASLSWDGTRLYFGSNRPGGEGSTDIYVSTRTQAAKRTARARAKPTVNCSKPPYRNKIRGTLVANVEISVYPGVCVVTGRVKGNVTVRSSDRRCARAADYVALSLKGGTIDGRVNATGKQCVMVWIFDGGLVKGSIDYRAAGNLGFLGDRRGARVRGNVLVKNGRLWAIGASTTNHVDGNLVCAGGRPAGSPRLATRTNWDGAGADETDETVDVDGSTGGRYAGCRAGG